MLWALSKPSNYKDLRQWAHHAKDLLDVPSMRTLLNTLSKCAIRHPRTIHLPRKDEAPPIQQAYCHRWVDPGHHEGAFGPLKAWEMQLTNERPQTNKPAATQYTAGGMHRHGQTRRHASTV